MVVKTAVHFFCAIFALLFMLTAQAKVKAVADRTVLSINESLILQLIQTETSGGAPDLTILENDFSITSQSQSQQYSIINGKSSKKHIWTINLLPKKTGEVIIPTLKIGAESTAPIHLVIQKSSQNSTKNGKVNSNQDVFIDVQISPKQAVYVQQKIDLKIRIYYRIRLSNLALAALVINDVIMEQVGEDKQYNKIINKHTYMVIERHYALFPQKSGFLTIPAIRFEAMQGSSSGFFSQRGRPIYKQSNSINIEVKKKPGSFTGKYWLPAENVQVISQHSDLSDIKVGDSITLTDKIIAKGVLGSLLPSISWPKIKQVKSYPDQPKNNSQADKDEIYGLREEKMAIIPMRSGSYQLPDRKITWWNTQTNQQQEKIIPGIRFQVSEAENSISLSDKQAKQKNSLAPTEKQSIQPDSQAKDSEHLETAVINKSYTGYQSIRENPWFWAWLASSLVLATLLIISLFFIYRSPVSSITENKSKDKKRLDQQQLLNKIKKSCANNDKTATINLLIQWANMKFSNKTFTNLNHLSQKINHPELGKEILKLEQNLYSAQPAKPWQGNDLYQALKNYLNKSKKDKKNRQNKGSLKPLNPL